MIHGHCLNQLILINCVSKTFMMADRIFDLEDRLVDFTCRMIDVVDALPDTRAGNYIASQLVKSCHSPSLNYAEAQAAESINDFVHKLGVVLKELKECRMALKIIGKKELIKPVSKLDDIFKETQALIAIIAKSIGTSKKRKDTLNLKATKKLNIEH